MRYEPVHCVTNAKRASNPRGLKNVAPIRARVDGRGRLLLIFRLVLTITVFHLCIFFAWPKCSKCLVNSYIFWLTARSGAESRILL